MSNTFESNLIKIPAKEVVDELYGKPPSKGERDIAEFRKKKIKKPEKMKSQENRDFFKNLISRETKSLKQFFGTDTEVPDLPEEITPEKYQEWKEMGFELHYLPEIDMAEDKKYSGWEKKPGMLFVFIKTGNMDRNATMLKAGWILIDERVRPLYDEGRQMYENDPLREPIKRLRSNGIIAASKMKDSRFSISYDELQKKEVREALAEVLRVNPEKVSLPRVIEWNFLINTFYQKWGYDNTTDNTYTSEWFEDKVEGESHLCGDATGLDANLGYISDDRRLNSLGFRPIVRFSEK